MYETAPKGTQHPCMKYGNQKSQDFLSTPTRNPQRTYPGSGFGKYEGNEQHKLVKQGNGLLGSVSCGSGKFGTEKPAMKMTPDSGKKA